MGHNAGGFCYGSLSGNVGNLHWGHVLRDVKTQPRPSGHIRDPDNSLLYAGYRRRHWQHLGETNRRLRRNYLRAFRGLCRTGSGAQRSLQKDDITYLSRQTIMWKNNRLTIVSGVEIFVVKRNLAARQL
jgi:hypothetical protein